MASALSSSVTRPRAASAIRFRRTGSVASLASPAARASGSSGATRRPVSPSATTSGIPPTRVATTGRPATWASTATLPMPSFREGITSTSNSGRSRWTSRRRPRKCTYRPTSSDSASRPRAVRSGPSPTSPKCTGHPQSRSRATAWIARSTPFTWASRATQPTRNPPSGRSRSVRRRGVGCRKRSTSTPLGITVHWSGRPTPSRRCSSLSESVRATRTSVHRASIFSTHTNARLFRRPP